MDFNLIHHRWIPVRRRDGTRTKIAPWEITGDFASNPVAALDAPRPDFNGALAQFLIGLIQTVAAPASEEEWEDSFHEPPPVEELKEAFSSVAHAFNLGGDGARFMQDFETSGGDVWNVASLLLESPGENTLLNNQDHFAKRNHVHALCPSCYSSAIFSLQTNAPYGGVGHQSSIRGGGPLTTLVLLVNDSGTLWQNTWLNILEKDSFLRISCNPKRTAESDTFPWLSPTQTSEKAVGKETFPEDVHPLHIFWAMPRRINFDLDASEKAECDVCGEKTTHAITSFRVKTFGYKYRGYWGHPLSPHRKTNEGKVPIQATPGGISYRHWLGIVQKDLKAGREPVLVLHKFIENRWSISASFRLWAFGYDLDPKRPTKARCWYEFTMPLIALPAEIREDYESRVAGMVTAAQEVAGNTRKCVKQAWFKRPKDVRGDTGFIDSRFWQETEGDFYAGLEALKTALEKDDEAALTEGLRSWHTTICRTSQTIFDSLAWDGPVEHANSRRVVLARRDLAKFNKSKKITLELLGLTPADRVVR